MKRPPQLWVISIGILCLSLLPSTNAVRATSLIFAKTTTSTTSTEAPAEGETKDEASTVASADTNQTSTKPPLTGNPQIDYIYDPNLPFELKGYNLSDYPFYDGLPEEIDFKCDGLHDGFYASVPHKCQVYHHCLYGTRYDFLCANFTAFDQRTFICHFVSEVDCINSKNFWHRNDALYQAATTTTIAPVTTAIPFTPSPALNPALRRPSPALAAGGGRRRRPYRRRRPQYEYYYDDDEEYDVERDREEYYDDPPARNGGRRRNKRPRPNRRPEYEEYDDYEADRYDRRPSRRDEDRDRRPYDRREDDRRRPTGGSKNKDRRTEDVDDRRSNDDKKRPVVDDKKPVDDRRRPVDDRRTEDEYERRPYDRRKPSRDRYDDEDREEDRRRPYDRKRPQIEDDRRSRPKDPKVEDNKDDARNRKPVDEGRWRQKDFKTDDRSRPNEESKVLIKPSSGTSVYDRPRAPPIIRRPVAKTEQDKYGYKPPVGAKTLTTKVVPEEDEYYDEYEEEPKLPAPKPTRKSTLDSRESEERRVYARPRRPQLVSKKTVVPIDDDLEEVPRRPLPKRPLDRSQERTRDQERSQERTREQDRSQERTREQDRSQERTREQPKPKFDSNKKLPIEEEEYIDDYEDEKSNSKQDTTTSRERTRPKFNLKDSRETAARPETTSKETTSRERDHRPEPVVKISKRPFLPSRGGNPYVSRGLQPVGSKALDITTDTSEKKLKDETIQSQEQIETSPRPIINNLKPITLFQTSKEDQKIIEQEEENKSSDQSKPQSDEYYDEEEFKPVTSRPKTGFRNLDHPRTTQKPKIADNYRNPLDINENEYDVTLNDALNPTLPNLPVRSIPTGFSNNGRDGYITQNYQRPRLIPVESAALSSASSDYVYQVKQPQNSQAQALRYNPYVTVQQLNYRQSPASSGQYYTTY